MLTSDLLYKVMMGSIEMTLAARKYDRKVRKLVRNTRFASTLQAGADTERESMKIEIGWYNDVHAV